MTVAVLGAGAWGTALAQVAAANGAAVRLWARRPEVAAAIDTERENRAYLPGVALSERVEATGDLAAAVDAEIVLVVTPAQAMRGVLERMGPYRGVLVLCSKGIEAGTLRLMSEVAAEAQPGAALAVLSGPTFAHEVAAGLPTAVTLAAAAASVREAVAARLGRPGFRLYASDDVPGAEIGGAVKNVLAIACGVVEGAGLGQNARAALIARGHAEMTRFGLARGGRAATLAGLSGLGDLVLTCSSTSSRNFSLGVGLGQGRAAAELLADRRTVAEGASTAPVLAAAARAVGVEMPVTDAVVRLLTGTDRAAVVADLLARPMRGE